MAAPERRRWNRQRILEVALEMLDEAGFEGLTTASLAKRMGVQPPALYRHYANLDELRGALQARGAAILAAHLRDAAIGRTGSEALRGFADTWREFARQHPGLHELLGRQFYRLADGSLHPDLIDADKRIIHTGLRLLETEGLSGETAIHALRGLRSLLTGFCAIEHQGGFQRAEDAAASFAYGVEAYLRGLRPGHTGSGAAPRQTHGRSAKPPPGKGS